ncbi:MAG: hypothetical protein RBT60_04415 [Candidatus Krumholzibacteria bacterium]|jgi:hypothetical protein|nr:hypothetical protein [Candidatus Krumholzibacteria bacterium]
MSVATTANHPLLVSVMPPGEPVPPEPLLDELRDLARRQDHCSARSRLFHEQLRKMLGQDRLVQCLLGTQALAIAGEPAGARLLAALLDANTPGALLLPRVRRFRSTGRLLVADLDLVGSNFLSDWQVRLADLVAACTVRFGAGDDHSHDHDQTPPSDRPPLPLLRRALSELTPGPDRTATPSAEDQRLLANLIRLECDAYQERVSRLAGDIDPFRVTAVMRVLPLLSRADAEVRDLDLLASWLEQGEFAQAFARQMPTAFDVLDDNERQRFAAAMQREEALAPLASVYAAFLASPRSIRHLAGPVARLLVLGRALTRVGLREEPLHLLDAVRLVLTHSTDDCLQIPLKRDLAAAVDRILLAAGRGGQEDLSGLEIRSGKLRLQQPRLALGDRIWRHDLPTAAEMLGEESAEQEEQKDTAPDTSAAAIKQMVLNNICSVSIVLGFLRNPKVTGIPGLVAEVVRRTRSSRVLEVITADRHLTSGHPNKDVPLALLESPVNISVKTLRQFIHVKYVSKTDLRRLAKDKARLRKEVCQEIENYLETLT